MTITQVITPLPPGPNPLTDTPAVFSEKAAASVAAQQGLPPEINAWRIQANALEANVNAKEIATNADALATAADRVQTGLDRVQTGQDRAAAAASAATIGVTAAFSDANPMVKNAADNSKMGKFKANLISPGVTREWELPDRNGKLALADDTALVLVAPSFTPADNATTIDFLNVFTPTYDNYKILIRTMEGSLANGDSISLRFAVAGIVDANARYNYLQVIGGNNNNAVAATSGRAVGNLYNVSLSGEIEVFNANGTNTSKAWISRGLSNGSTGPIIETTHGFYIGASAITGFRLFVSGAFAKFLAKGSIEVYGYKKAMT